MAFKKSMAKGSSVEEMVRFSEVGDFAYIIQLNLASYFVGEAAYVVAGSHCEELGLEVQFVEVVSRKVMKVKEPAGKGPIVSGVDVKVEEGRDEEEL